MAEAAANEKKLAVVKDAAEAPEGIGGVAKPPVDPASLAHAALLQGPFWQRIPAYAGVSEAEFLDHRWQAKHSITKIPKLLEAVAGLVSTGSATRSWRAGASGSKNEASRKRSERSEITGGDFRPQWGRRYTQRTPASFT